MLSKNDHFVPQDFAPFPIEVINIDVNKIRLPPTNKTLFQMKVFH